MLLNLATGYLIFATIVVAIRFVAEVIHVYGDDIRRRLKWIRKQNTGARCRI